MLALREYRDRSDRLADHLPWAALVAPGVVLNKDGSFQRSFAFRGPDLESATQEGLVAACARANNVLKRFGTGWALFFESTRVEAPDYPMSAFPDPASWIVDAERRAAFERAGAHFENHNVLTLVFLPDADAREHVGRAMIARGQPQKGRDWRQLLATFIAETDRAHDLFQAFLPDIEPLGDGETLSYLHRTISVHSGPVAVPETPMYLDGILVDTPLIGGLAPRLGNHHLRTLTILGFPGMSRPALFDAMNHLDFGYRWMTRFIALDRVHASRALTRLRRQWFNKRKSVSALLREVLYNQPAQLLDSDADNKAADADLALQALGADHVAFGYLTTTITVIDSDASAVDGKLRAVERVVNGLGFASIREEINAVEAWLSSLPGQVYANVRQPLIHTLNLAHLMPMSAVWAGPAGNAHLDGPPLLLAETGGSTPFRLSTHVADVGHMFVVGPTGAGKSVLLALIALQFRRYPHALICMFDKGCSARAAILAMGGTHHILGLGTGDAQPIAFQPLRHIDKAEEQAWASEWVLALIAQEGVESTPQLTDAVWSAITSLASAPPEERTMTGLSLMIQNAVLRAALAPYTLEGPYGPLLDAACEDFEARGVLCFEAEALMAHGRVIAPVLSYLFHRLEARFDGRPTLLVLDEAWIFLDHPLFATRIREWLKTLRKKNVAVVFATQSLSDIAGSTIAPAIIESCPQRIFLPNDRASEPQIRQIYEGFGLSARQIEIISRATPRRDYYLQSSRGNRLFELGLGPVALALCASASPEDQRRIDALLAEPHDAPFAQRFLQSAALDWAAGLVAQFGAPHEEGEKP